MAMIPITREQRDEAELEGLNALMESLAERLNANFNDQIEKVSHSVALLVATSERPTAALH
ncbi:hypothetical protein OCT51_11170 [Halomonas sp. LR3S48]|uniref:hypothetical protein n=1 Tax=Halomonas sp. LR3S48 TaxID=2982694 RepID=UPI0021E4FFFF|nr:hypothetical protein [Halomonas sp. LR3S48]UYG01774.1 hypothetical protein OCT51_11170 [Halomonas sp. LR3S48]